MIIAFAGKAGSGKDTAADYFEDRRGFTKRGLADPIKRIAGDLFGFTDEQLYGPSAERDKPDRRYPFQGTCPYCRNHCSDIGSLLPSVGGTAKHFHCSQCQADFWPWLTPRAVLQTLGTEWGRTLDPDIWTRRLISLYRAETSPRWVINDVRFPNEVDLLAREGAFVVKIVRSAAERPATHASEAMAVPDSAFCAVIHNEGAVEDLYSLLDDLYAAILSPTATPETIRVGALP